MASKKNKNDDIWSPNGDCTSKWSSIPKPIFIDSDVKAKKLALKMSRKKVIALDTETTGLNKVFDRILFWSLSDGVNRYTLSVSSLEFFKPILEDKKVTKLFWNAKYDLHMFLNSGIRVRGKCLDGMIMIWLLDENLSGSLGLKDSSAEFLDSYILEFKEIFKISNKKKKEEVTDDHPIHFILPENDKRRKFDIGHELVERIINKDEIAIDYASSDAWNTYKLVRDLDVVMDGYQLPMPGFKKARGSWGSVGEYYHTVEVPYTRVLFNMERRGIRLDEEYLLKLGPELISRKEEIQAKINKSAGYPVNLNSPAQLGKFLFEDKKIKFTAKTASGQYATDEKTLEKLATSGEEEAKLILDSRSLSKTYGTYVKGLLRNIGYEEVREGEFRKTRQYIDGRIHTTLNQAGTVTGRLSSSEPNLQNIPRPGSDLWKLRKSFVAEKGNILIGCDYDQLEMMVLAHWSGDDNMINGIINGLDLHCHAAALSFEKEYKDIFDAKNSPESLKSRGYSEEDIDKLLELRQGAKTIGFGLVYGKQAVSLARDLGIDVSEAEKLIKKYFSGFPDVGKFIKTLKDRAYRLLYVQTLFGRIRRLPNLQSKNFNLRNDADRQITNSVIQGSAADILRKAMIQCESNKDLRKLKCKMLMQIHDELMFEMPNKEHHVKEATEIIQDIMENPFETPLNVPLRAKPEVGESWMDIH